METARSVERPRLTSQEVWKQPGRLPAEGRLGSSETQASRGVVFFVVLASLASLHMCHLFGIRSLVS
jgi:hypothetical protein